MLLAKKAEYFVGSPSQQILSEATDKAETISLGGCDLEERRFRHGFLLLQEVGSGCATGTTRLLLLLPRGRVR